MTILPVVAASAIILTVAYVVYGRLLMRWLGVDPSRTTPAVAFDDGNDFVPAPAPVVLGGHFTAIAAAGPIVGPIVAGLAFGWVPALLWILIGSIFIGGVHDAGSLLASLRHRAASITVVVREHMSRAAYVTFLLFVWICLVYVVIAFADVTANSFAKFQTLAVTEGGATRAFVMNGGAVAVGATAYLLLSVAVGLLQRFTRVPWWALLVAAVALLSLTIWHSAAMAGWLSTHGLPFLDTRGKDAGALAKNWDQALLVYCFVASVTPMWLLLQPRGVIGATFLYAALLFGVVGTLVGGWDASGSLAVQWPAFKGFVSDRGEPLFPFLFIMVACGACSGFHSVVATGTTCKQVRTERDVKPVAYGAMLLEAMVAVLALSCVMVMVPGSKVASPDVVYAGGVGNFMALCGIPKAFGIGFGLLAFSSFVFDTMDVCTRLGRYVLQEMTGLSGKLGGAVATLLTLAGPSAYLAFSPPESFKTFWTIFGTSNQLLAALTLVGVAVWLWRTGRPVWYAIVPAIFMVVTTGTALAYNFRFFYRQYAPAASTPALVNMCIAGVLFLLGGLVVFEALRVWRMARLRPVAIG